MIHLVPKLQKHAGFSLIELLVVVAIIAILAAVGVANLRGASRKARDARRVSDLEQIRGGLELYRSDAARYPANLPNCGAMLTFGSNTYIKTMPCDPQSQQRYSYVRNGGGFGYNLGTVLEQPSGLTSPVACNTTGLGGGVTYCITNP